MKQLAIPLLAWLFVAFPARAEEEILRCHSGDPRMPAADSALEELRDAIRHLAPDGSAGPADKALTAALAQPCLALAAAEAPVLPTASTPALAWKTWWADGGEAWLDSQVGGDAATAVIPPDVRPELSLEGNEDSPLAPLLCKAANPLCGIETKGWRRRAERAFDAQAVNEGKLLPSGIGAPTQARPVLANCKDKAAGEYHDWRSCVGTNREEHQRLPLGSFRAPDSGYLVVRGRRGHYSFCDELRVYSLSDGSAWIASSCSGLALQEDGSVDGNATDRTRKSTVLTGHLPVDNLREAAWMLAFIGQIQETRDAIWAPLPAGMVMEIPVDRIGGEFGINVGGIWGSSAQTLLAWSWVRDGQTILSGQTTWPDSSNFGENHADELLRVAESALVPGCVDAGLPIWVFSAKAPGVSAVDAPAGVHSAQENLRDDLQSFGCKP